MDLPPFAKDKTHEFELTSFPGAKVQMNLSNGYVTLVKDLSAAASSSNNNSHGKASFFTIQYLRNSFSSKQRTLKRGYATLANPHEGKDSLKQF